MLLVMVLLATYPLMLLGTEGLQASAAIGPVATALLALAVVWLPLRGLRARMPQSWHIASRKPLCDGLSSFWGCALMVPLSAMSLRADPLGAQLERQLPLLLERHGVARA